MQKFASAPAPGRTPTEPLGSANASPAKHITFSPKLDPWPVDVAIRGGRYVRYLSSRRPGHGAGLWRTGPGGVPELLSPFAVTRIEIGQRGGIAIALVLPRTQERYVYEGDPDTVASALWQAGRRIGCATDRQAVFWAIRDLCGAVRRQATARGRPL